MRHRFVRQISVMIGEIKVVRLCTIHVEHLSRFETG